MPVSLTWWVDKQIIYQRLEGILTMDELVESSLESHRMQETSPYKVHHIIDMTAVTQHPMQLEQFRDMMKVITDKDIGWTLLVAQNKLVRFLASMVFQIVVPQARMRFMTSFEEASDFLKGIEPVLKAHSDQPSSEPG